MAEKLRTPSPTTAELVNATDALRRGMSGQESSAAEAERVSALVPRKVAPLYDHPSSAALRESESKD